MRQVPKRLPDISEEVHGLRNFKEDITRFRHMTEAEQWQFRGYLSVLASKLGDMQAYDLDRKLKEKGK